MPKVITDTPKTRKRSKTVLYSFKVLDRQLESMRKIGDNDGTPVAEQIRRGIDLWIQQQKRRVK